MATLSQSDFDAQHAPHPGDPYLVAMTPDAPTPIPEIVAALRGIDALEGLTEDEYTWLAAHGTERRGSDGALIFREGAPTCHMIFILLGEIHVRRHNSGPMALFVGRAGAMTGKLPFSRMKGYGGDGYTIGPAWTLDIHQDLFPEMLRTIPSMGQRCVNTLLDRVREVTRMEQQAEKLAALGKLAANLAHELNNPASAAQRSAASVFTELRHYGDQKYQLGALCLEQEQNEAYRAWMAEARRRLAQSTTLDPAANPLAINDREDTLTQWLVDHSIPAPWTIAPPLAETQVPLSFLDELAALMPPKALPIALRTIASAVRVERMAQTVVDSTARIFDLISAIKDYSYMDQAPIQEIDVAQSLTTTLAMFQSRLQNVRVETDFDPTLPPISAYGSELNQVWTAILENALDAMQALTANLPAGTLRISTRHHGQMATVEIADTGRGIPANAQSRIFEPFFTTKPVGSALGLGLDIAQRIVGRHSGFIKVESRPGATCLEIRIPIERAGAY